MFIALYYSVRLFCSRLGPVEATATEIVVAVEEESDNNLSTDVYGDIEIPLRLNSLVIDTSVSVVLAQTSLVSVDTIITSLERSAELVVAIEMNQSNDDRLLTVARNSFAIMIYDAQLVNE